LHFLQNRPHRGIVNQVFAFKRILLQIACRDLPAVLRGPT
jgi:hypothetical protein